MDNLNEEINRNKELMGVLNEQNQKRITPEERITDSNCVGTDTPKVVLDIVEELTSPKSGYECVGRAEKMTSGYDPQPMSEVVLKKNIQGVSIYAFIQELAWVNMTEVGDVSYYAPKTAPGDSVYYEGEEGHINYNGQVSKVSGELEVIEDKILDSIKN